MQNELIVDVRLWGSLVGVLAWDESSEYGWRHPCQKM